MHSLRLRCLVVSLGFVLSACGGGGGGGDSAAVVPPVTSTGPTVLVASSTVANRCEKPRTGSGAGALKAIKRLASFSFAAFK